MIVNQIAKETRREGQKIINKTNLKDLVYEELEEQELTARQLAEKMYKKRDNKNRCKTRSSTKTQRTRKEAVL